MKSWRNALKAGIENMTTERIRKAVIWAFVLSALFPPFLQQTPRGHAGCGYGFLLNWPTGKFWEIPCRVDVPLLAMEWVFLLVCMTWLHRAQIVDGLRPIVSSLSSNSEAQVQAARINADTQTEAARILAIAIVRHAEELRIQKSMF